MENEGIQFPFIYPWDDETTRLRKTLDASNYFGMLYEINHLDETVKYLTASRGLKKENKGGI